MTTPLIVPEDDFFRVINIGGTPQQVLTFTLPYVKNEDIRLTRDGVLQSPTLNYTLVGTPAGNGLGFTGGTITLTTPDSNAQYIVARVTPIERVSNFPTTGPFNIAALNLELSRVVMILQEENATDFTLRVPPTEGVKLVELPLIADRRNGFAAFDNDGQPVIASGVSSVPVSTYGEGLVSQPNSAGARQYLGINESALGPDIIINGDMFRRQRGSTFNSMATKTYTAERWRCFANGSFNNQVDAVVTNVSPDSLSRRSLALTCSPAVTTPPGTPGTGFSMQQLAERTRGLATGWFAADAIEKVEHTALSARFAFYAEQQVTFCANLINNGDQSIYIKEFTHQGNGWQDFSWKIPPPPNTLTLGNPSLIFDLVFSPEQNDGTDGIWQLSAVGITKGTAACNNLFDTVQDYRFTQVQLLPIDRDGNILPYRGIQEGETQFDCNRFFQSSYGINFAPGATSAEGCQHTTAISTDTTLWGLERRFSDTLRGNPTIRWYSDITGAADMVRNRTLNADVAVTSTVNETNNSSGNPVLAVAPVVGHHYSAHWTAEDEYN